MWDRFGLYGPPCSNFFSSSRLMRRICRISCTHEELNELCCNDARRHGSVDGDDSPEILLGDLAGEVKRFRIDPLGSAD
jgi:hypothetical protein